MHTDKCLGQVDYMEAENSDRRSRECFPSVLQRDQNAAYFPCERRALRSDFVALASLP